MTYNRPFGCNFVSSKLTKAYNDNNTVEDEKGKKMQT